MAKNVKLTIYHIRSIQAKAKYSEQTSEHFSQKQSTSQNH